LHPQQIVQAPGVCQETGRAATSSEETCIKMLVVSNKLAIINSQLACYAHKQTPNLLAEFSNTTEYNKIPHN